MLNKPENSTQWRDSYYHKLFGLKAANEVERLLPLFEIEVPSDARPRQAVLAIRQWAEGKRKLTMAEVRKLSLGAVTLQRMLQGQRWQKRLLMPPDKLSVPGTRPLMRSERSHMQERRGMKDFWGGQKAQSCPF